MEISSDLKQRYSRQIAIKDIGVEGQLKLMNSKVLIIGCGALGSMTAMQLAAAGIGELGIADFDSVDISNLQRQFFFENSEAGKNKVDVIFERILKLNPSIKVNRYHTFITSKKAKELFPVYDFIVDATDNPDSKKMVGQLSMEVGIPCCIAGVRDFEGQIMTLLPKDARFEDFFGVTLGESVLPCSLGGVIGPAAALCASLQAAETIKYITGIGKLLSGEILFFNLLNNNFKIFSL